MCINQIETESRTIGSDGTEVFHHRHINKNSVGVFLLYHIYKSVVRAVCFPARKQLFIEIGVSMNQPMLPGVKYLSILSSLSVEYIAIFCYLHQIFWIFNTAFVRVVSKRYCHNKRNIWHIAKPQFFCTSNTTDGVIVYINVYTFGFRFCHFVVKGRRSLRCIIANNHHSKNE